MEEKNKKLKLMRYWLVGLFALFFASITTILYILTFGDVFKALVSGWQMWGLAAVLCVAVYYGYKAYLNRK